MRTKLVALEYKHIDQALVWRNNPKISNWCRQYRPITMLDQEQWYREQSEDPKIQMFAVETRCGVHIGVGGLTSIDFVNRKAEFSLYIGPEHWRKGHARDALALIVGYGFNELGLNLIWGETFDGNPAQKMFEQVGFKKTGTMPGSYWKKGRFIDAHIYCLNRSDKPDRYFVESGSGVDPESIGK